MCSVEVFHRQYLSQVSVTRVLGDMTSGPGCGFAMVSRLAHACLGLPSDWAAHVSARRWPSANRMARSFADCPPPHLLEITISEELLLKNNLYFFIGVNITHRRESEGLSLSHRHHVHLPFLPNISFHHVPYE